MSINWHLYSTHSCSVPVIRSTLTENQRKRDIFFFFFLPLSKHIDTFDSINNRRTIMSTMIEQHSSWTSNLTTKSIGDDVLLRSLLLQLLFLLLVFLLNSSQIRFRITPRGAKDPMSKNEASNLDSSFLFFCFSAKQSIRLLSRFRY